jgi:hypothetical protein
LGSAAQLFEKEKVKSFYRKTQYDLNANAFRATELIQNVGDYASTLDLYDALKRGVFERHLAPPAKT